VGFGASPLVMVRRRRAQLDEARFIEKIGGCNDAYTARGEISKATRPRQNRRCGHEHDPRKRHNPPRDRPRGGARIPSVRARGSDDPGARALAASVRDERQDAADAGRESAALSLAVSRARRHLPDAVRQQEDREARVRPGVLEQ
jgi:hypothetical protein